MVSNWGRGGENCLGLWSSHMPACKISAMKTRFVVMVGNFRSVRSYQKYWENIEASFKSIFSTTDVLHACSFLFFENKLRMCMILYLININFYKRTKGPHYSDCRLNGWHLIKIQKSSGTYTGTSLHPTPTRKFSKAQFA